MEDNLGFPDRRNLDRLNTKQLATYTRYDKLGKPCEQTTAKLINVSLRGVRVQSSFPVETGEVLDVTVVLGDNLVDFKGKVAHVAPSEDEGFELGISIEDIEDQQKSALVRFLSLIHAQV